MRALRAGGAAALLLVLAASTALGAHLALTLGSASNATLGEHVVVNPQGRTLYALSPETTRHLLCKSRACLTNWPPLTVQSSRVTLKSAGGAQGRLGILRRGNGTLQVTLRGLPLYRYSGDHAKGDAHGDGKESFGGTWHAVTASRGETVKPAMPSPAPSTPTMPSTTTTSTSTTPTPPPYQYPPY